MNNNNNKEPEVKKTFWEETQEKFGVVFTWVGVIVIVLLILWIPFKLVPYVYNYGTNFVSTTLSSLFIDEKATSTQQTINTNNNYNTGNKNTAQTTNTGTTHSKVPTQVSYYGKPDLQISLIETGIIDPATKQFIATNYAGFNDEIGIRFEVKNVGTNISGQWKLRINSPSRTTPYYDSPYQISVKPGDRMIFTTSFSSPTSLGINTAYITVDPLTQIDESSRNNNQIIVPIKIEGTNYSYNNNYNYGSNTPTTNLAYGSLYTWTNINVNCYANPQTSYVGNPITWYATASGGNGYFTYSWTGSDSMNGNQSAVSQTFYSSGTKVATVTVTSNGQSVTKQCSAYIY